MKISKYLFKKARENPDEFRRLAKESRRLMKDSYNERADACNWIYKVCKLFDADRKIRSVDGKFFGEHRKLPAEIYIAYTFIAETFRHPNLDIAPSSYYLSFWAEREIGLTKI